jgi:hypothetical protein
MALQAGIDAAAFWDLTPYQTRLSVRADNAAMLTLAWHVAALGQQRKLPKLEKLLGSAKGRQQMTGDQIKAVMMGLGKAKNG